jgi:hypothetical protein
MKKSLNRTKNQQKNVKIKKFVKYQNRYGKQIQFKNNDFYNVEAIRDRRGTDENPEYLIKWEGWHENTNTWEPVKNVRYVGHLIREFEANRNPNKNLSFLEDHLQQDESDELEKLLSDDAPLEGIIGLDEPEKILKIRRGHNYDNDFNDIEVKIRWSLRRSTGVQPTDSYVKNSELKKSKPYATMLADYYENFLVFTKKNYNNK